MLEVDDESIPCFVVSYVLAVFSCSSFRVMDIFLILDERMGREVSVY